MSYFLHHPYKAGNLELLRPVVFFRRGEKLKKKEDWLDGVGKRPMSFGDGLARGNVKNYSSKAKLLGGVQVYPEDFLQIVVY